MFTQGKEVVKFVPMREFQENYKKMGVVLNIVKTGEGLCRSVAMPNPFVYWYNKICLNQDINSRLWIIQNYLLSNAFVKSKFWCAMIGFEHFDCGAKLNVTMLIW